MQPIPYLFFRGNCAQAMKAYGALFGAEPQIMPFSAMPSEAKAQMPGVPDDAAMHAALKVGEGWLYASDDLTPGGPAAMAGANVHLSLPTVDEAHRVFDALSDNGEVRMALAPTFWAPAFGACTDRFGIRWMISADPPAA